MPFKPYSAILLTTLLTLSGITYAVPEEKPFANDDAKYSYVLGAQFAYSLQSQDVAKIDIAMVAKALHDILEDKPTLISEEEINATFNEFRQKAKDAAIKKRKDEALANKEASTKFLEENKTKEGVKVTENGLQYKIITEGTGISPDADDKVTVQYRGTFIDGKEFDSSYKRGKPYTCNLRGSIIKGWKQGIPLMKEGAKYRFYIPSDLAYGPNGRRSIPGNSALIFDVELIEVIKQDAPKKAANPKAQSTRR